ncbi:ABC transporter ATP-binding protein [Leifsonia sp. SIMBA_070]|uniref:ABC transporter ATP-binding protein n=1 Tax=Leifsonia sp. SIMBA_070 TaxID=3085810 RepID=UPI00397E4352
MIELIALKKQYGDKVVVNGVTSTIQPGRVTGFLGPNGAGKSTTMRMIMGFDSPTDGRALVNGRRYSESRAPLTEVGALLDAKAVHPGRTAREHLLSVAATHRIGKSRVAEVIELTGLEAVAGRRVGTFSLGMGQRLGIATALLGDPGILILDEPVNGLDPDGVRWVRQLTRRLADEGRTVFLSSHLMSEMAVTADHLLIIGRGEVIADAPISDILAKAGTSMVRVRTPRAPELAGLLEGRATDVETVRGDGLLITGLEAEQIADLAAAQGIPLHELTTVETSLEDAYTELTRNHVEYQSEVNR